MYLKKKALFRLLVVAIFCLALCACAFRDIFFSGAYYPAIAHDPINGRYLAVYLKVKVGHPDAGGKGDSRLYGVFIDSNGSSAGNEFLISGDPAYYYCPAIVFDYTHGQYLVIWNSDDNIFVQFINSDGSLSGTRLTMTNEAITPCGRCAAVSYSDTTQKFLVAWGAKNLANHDSLYAQLLNADGSFAGSRLAVSDDGASPASPSIAYDEQLQRFLVVWDSADYLQIKGRMINPDGTFVANEFPISSATGTHWFPTVAYNSVDARFLVAWEHSAANTFDLVGQLLNADGSFYKSIISISAAGRYVSYHASVYNPLADNYFILFGDYTKELLYAQVVRPDGTLDTTVSNDNIPISYADYPGDRRPVAAFDIVNNRYFAGWVYGLTGCRDSWQEAFDDIHGRLVNADGSPVGEISVVSNGGVW